jgi:hypothetical protein
MKETPDRDGNLPGDAIRAGEPRPPTIEDMLDLFEHRVIQQARILPSSNGNKWQAANRATETARSEILGLLLELRSALKTGYGTIWAMKARLGVPVTEQEKRAVDVLNARLDVLKKAIERTEGK